MSELKWIKHDGGPMPVPGDTIVARKMRCEADGSADYFHQELSADIDPWEWDYESWDTVEYAIVTPSPTQRDPTSPAHYKSGGIECIDAIRAALTPEEFRGYCKGNMLKYAWRERNKGGDEDLRKAAVYAGFATEKTDG